MTSTAPAPPVAWDPHLGAFRVSRFAEASQVLRGEGWSSDPGLSPLTSEALRDMPPGTLVFTDPPEHTRLRRQLAPAFTPQAIGRLRPRVVAVIDAVLDGLADAPGGEVDILADVAHPVTLAVIAELLDVGVEGAHLFAEHTPQLSRMLELDATAEDMMASAIASTEMMLFLTPIIAERRQHPGEDFISALLALVTGDDVDDAAAAGGLSLQEVMATCILLLAAGHETTSNMITNSTLALLTHPDQQQHLHAHPERAIEELLRLQGAAKLAGRTATRDHYVAGTHIPTGAAVLVDLHQANRDPDRLLDPARMDLSREPVGHLAFGAGVHFCLGAALARLETVETLTRVFTRYPDLTLVTQTPRWRESSTFRGVHELQVRTGT